MPNKLQFTPPENGPFRFIAVDVEAAAHDVVGIWQIGLAFVRIDRSIETYSTYIDPCTRFAEGNTQLHGIGFETTRDAPTCAEALPELRFVLETQPLAQHSRFDKKSFDDAGLQAKLPFLKSIWTDSVAIARKAWSEFRGNGEHGLANLKKEFGPLSQQFDAGEDTRAADQVAPKAENSLGAELKVRNSARQLVFDL